MIIEKDILEKNIDKSIMEIAVELRVSVQTVMASLNKYGIPFDKPTHIYGDLKRTNFSSFQKSILIGSVLGDGHIEKRIKLKNASFREEHSIDQYEWLKWKHDNLKPFTTSDTWVRDRGSKYLMPDGKGGKRMYNIQNVCAMSTNTHPYLSELHRAFYKDRIKVVPENFLLDNFDDVALYVLICDDGNFSDNSLRICTDSFSKKEVYFLSDLFAKFFKGRVTVREEKPNKFRVVFTEISRDMQFFTRAKAIIPECMYHKFSPVLNEHQAATL